MIQLLFTVLIAFSCFEGSNSENKCGNVEQRTVGPPNIKCPNKPPITNPIWKPASPERLRSALQNADDDSSCTKKNEAQKEAKEEPTQPPSCPPKPSCPSNPSTNKNSPVIEQKVLVEEKQVCSKFRRPGPERSYLDI